MSFRPEPRLLLSIDYEPWFALFSRYNSIEDDGRRRELDGDFSSQALAPILEILKGSAISFYLAGEIAHWDPSIPRSIVQAGHELGFHCQRHRPLLDPTELQKDLDASTSWRSMYDVRGYRAPMIKITEGCYPLLERAGFQYSSSVYAPSGTIMQRGNLTEVAVSTLKLFGNGFANRTLPRDLSLSLLLKGELPYGSSFIKGIIGEKVLDIVDQEMRKGHSPALILHPIELFFERPWSSFAKRHVLTNPKILPFVRRKTDILRKLVARFPTSSMRAYVDELKGAPEGMYE